MQRTSPSRPHLGSSGAAAWVASAATAWVVLGVASCGGAPEVPQLGRPNIVLVTVDTLRADHLGCYGYFRDTTPNIDALAKESVVFDQAYAVMATTLPSHASMFTARYPLEHGILANLMHGGNPFGWKDGMLSFAQVAKDAGYTTAGFVSAAPLKSQSGIAEGFDTWSEPEGVERQAEATMVDVLGWLASKPKEPYFLWVHFYDPHWKHKAPAPFDTLFHTDGPDPKLDAWLAERQIGDEAMRSNARKTTQTLKAINDYCGEVRYTDSHVGVLIDRLRSSGELDRSVFVLTADHGEGLNQHDWPAHGLVWDEQLRVPLVMRFPPAAKVAPARVGHLVSLVDLFPTVLARLEPWEAPSRREFSKLATGTDVLAPGFVERPIFAQRTGRELEDDPGEMYSITTREWKYIHEPEVGDKLFDRRKDPHELDNLAERDTKTAERVHGITMVMIRGQTARGAALGTAEAGAMDPEVLRQMQALGYLGGDDGRSDFEANETPAPANPKPDSEPRTEEPDGELIDGEESKAPGDAPRKEP
jgi:arylsulfatase A-like enzyme